MWSRRWPPPVCTSPAASSTSPAGLAWSVEVASGLAEADLDRLHGYVTPRSGVRLRYTALAG
jgi:hypothetical protein